MEKTCHTCDYCTTADHVEPCFSCSVNDQGQMHTNWKPHSLIVEPKVEEPVIKLCRNCLHKDIPGCAEPCFECSFDGSQYHRKWEPVKANTPIACPFCLNDRIKEARSAFVEIGEYTGGHYEVELWVTEYRCGKCQKTFFA